MRLLLATVPALITGQQMTRDTGFGGLGGRVVAEGTFVEEKRGNVRRLGDGCKIQCGGKMAESIHYSQHEAI